MSKVKISSKKFLLTSETKNDKGYTVRTEGVDMSHFLDNPILLWMHQRPQGTSKSEVLPLGYVTDIHKENNGWYGRLAFDANDKFAMELYEKVEADIIRMVSPGLAPIEWKKEGDELWLERSILKEMSLVDIGSNNKALGVALYSNSPEMELLSFDSIMKSETFKKEENMKLITLKAEELAPLLKLKAEAPDVEYQTAIQELVTLASDQAVIIGKNKKALETLQTNYNDLKTEKEGLEKLALDTKIETLVNGAFNDKKITADEKDGWVKLAHKDFDGVKEMLDKRQASPDVLSKIDNPKTEDKFQTLSWGDLDKKGLLVQLKADNFELFKTKYKEEFDKEYREDK